MNHAPRLTPLVPLAAAAMVALPRASRACGSAVDIGVVLGLLGACALLFALAQVAAIHVASAWVCRPGRASLLLGVGLGGPVIAAGLVGALALPMPLGALALLFELSLAVRLGAAVAGRRGRAVAL